MHASPTTGLPPDRFATPRYRVCAQAAPRTDYERRFASDSAEAAVHEFLITGPLPDGADVFLWDRQEKRIVAQIAWIDEKTTFGTTLRVRSNQFYDPEIAAIARQLCERAEIRHAVVKSIAV